MLPTAMKMDLLKIVLHHRRDYENKGLKENQSKKVMKKSKRNLYLFF